MGAESPVRPGRLSPRDPGVTGVVGEVWSNRRCTRMFGDYLPVGPHRPGLAPVFGSRSRVVSSTGVQAFSEAHGGRGTLRTVTHDNQAPQNAIWPASEAPIVGTYLEPLCRTLRLLADEEVEVQQNRHFEFEHRCALIPRLENIHKVIT
jgi:hypothetical protein